VDPLPAELEGEVETVLYEAFWFIEAAIILPRYKALLLADTGARGRERCTVHGARGLEMRRLL
jgi:hypothetical protein